MATRAASSYHRAGGRRRAGAGDAARALVPSAAGVSGLDAQLDMAAQAKMASFRMLMDPRRRRLSADGSGAYHVDAHTVEECRKISRWHEHNTATYSQLLSRWLQYLVGTGPEIIPNSPDPEWNARCADEIREALEDRQHDYTRSMDWDLWLETIARGIGRDGQHGILHTSDGGQQLDADRLFDYDVDERGRITHWHVAPWSESGVLDKRNARRIESRYLDVPRVLLRCSQGFGLPIMHSSLDDHDMLYGLWRAEGDAAEAAVGPWLLLQQRQGGPTPNTLLQAMEQHQANNPQPTSSWDGRAKAQGWLKQPGAGHIMGLPDGLEGTPWSPDRPNLDVPAFSKQMLAICCMVLLPYPVAFDDTSSLSSSNARNIERISERLLDSFRTRYLNRPALRVARSIISRRIAKGRLPAIQNWQNLRLQWPRLEIHDRHREIQADVAGLAVGRYTQADLQGPRWREHMAQRAKEWGEAATLAAAHNKEHPTHPITIHHILGDPGRVAQTLQALTGAAVPGAQPTNGEPPHDATALQDLTQ